MFIVGQIIGIAIFYLIVVGALEPKVPVIVDVVCRVEDRVMA
jgi:hypothetical protein